MGYTATTWGLPLLLHNSSPDREPSSFVILGMGRYKCRLKTRLGERRSLDEAVAKCMRMHQETSPTRTRDRYQGGTGDEHK